MVKDISERFCEKPFEFFEVNERGDVFCCCPGWLPTPIGNLKNNDLTDIWNSDTAKDIRTSILDGSFKYCRAKECPLIGNDTLPYRKDVSDPYLKEVIQKKLIVLDKKPKTLGLSYDRSCNLVCPSCRTSKIMIEGEEYSEKHKLQNRLLETGLNDAELLIITGAGDPFASKLYRELLATLDADKYPKLRIHLMTNGQLFTPRSWEKWYKVHKSIKSIQISIDAASEETYQLLRCGGDFKRLLVNLEFIMSLRKQSIFELVSIDFVVQQLNYKNMKDFIKLGKYFDVDRVGFAGIRNWGTFNPEAFYGHSIHLPTHPEHQQFLELIRDPIFKEPLVDMGNLTEFIST